LTNHQLDLLLQGVNRLFTLPSVAGRLLEQGQASVDIVRPLVGLDPALCLRLLTVAASQGPCGEDWPLDLAAVDDDQLVQELLAMPVWSDAVFRGELGEFPGPGFWVHCLAVAVLTQELAAMVRPDIKPSLAFHCGLLHDCGKFAAVACLPKSYSRALEVADSGGTELVQVERDILGVDHTTIGYRLAQQWRLPAALAETMWLHHQEPQALPSNLQYPDLVLAVALADRLARQWQLGYSGNAHVQPIEQAFLDHFGLSSDSIDQLQATTAPQVSQLADRLGLNDPAPQERYNRAMAMMSQSLSRRNAELAGRQVLLQAQAQAFTLLAEFAGSLGAEARVSDVLPRIAQIASAVFVHRKGGPLAAYAIDVETQQVLAIRMQDNLPQWRTMAAAPELARQSAAALAAPASPVLASLLANPQELDDWLDDLATEHRPLVCAGRWIGGLLMPGQAGGPKSADLAAVEDALCASMASALAIVQARSRAAQLSEQLAGASQVLAAAQEALSHTRTLAALGEMAAGAAHELNNPLAIISGRSQLMLRKAQTDPDRRLWQTMTEQAQKLSDIITELMEFASPTPPQASTFDARNVLQTAVNDFRADPQAASSTVDIEDGQSSVWVYADQQQVLSVLKELLRNAATAAQGRAVVHLRAYADDEGLVTLRVADQGPGMDPTTAAKAFTPFFSQQQAGRRRGLGLPRARRVIEANGGRIHLRSQANHGTTVVVQLPAAKEPPRENADVASR